MHFSSNLRVFHLPLSTLYPLFASYISFICFPRFAYFIFPSLPFSGSNSCPLPFFFLPFFLFRLFVFCNEKSNGSKLRRFAVSRSRGEIKRSRKILVSSRPEVNTGRKWREMKRFGEPFGTRGRKENDNEVCSLNQGKHLLNHGKRACCAGKRGGGVTNIATPFAARD